MAHDKPKEKWEEHLEQWDKVMAPFIAAAESQTSDQSTAELQKYFRQWGMHEAQLAADQPMLDLGYRIDYDRKGLVRPNHLIPLADLITVRDALRGCEARGEEAAVYRDSVTGVPFRLKKLEEVCDAFESHEERQEERRGWNAGDEWAASAPWASVEMIGVAFRRWLAQQGAPPRIEIESVFTLLPAEARGESYGYRRAFTEAVDGVFVREWRKRRKPQ